MANFSRNITIVGLGNVGSNLLRELSKKNLPVNQIVTTQSVNYKIDTTNDLTEIKKDNLVIICVPDHDISDVLNQIPKECEVAYTSGAVTINSLPSRARLGVFYPLQTFSKDREVKFDNIPILIESNNSEFTQELLELAKQISNNVKEVDSEYRKKLHLSAVYVNNFTNHIIYLAEQKAIENNVDFELLRPLLKETIDKLSSYSSYDAQTGPARRNDYNTIDAHYLLLTDQEKALYAIITKSIIDTYHHD